MNHIVTALDPRDEPVVATIDFRNVEGQSTLLGTLHVGYYPGPESDVWLEQEGRRVQLPTSAVDLVVAQMHRAAALAAEKGGAA